MPRQPWGNAVHRGSAFLDDWPYLLTIDRLRDHRVGVPDQACNVLDRDVMLREQRHEAVPKLPRCPVLAGEGGVVEYLPEVTADVVGGHLRAVPSREHQLTGVVLCFLRALRASTQPLGKARLCRDFGVLVSPFLRTERQTGSRPRTGQGVSLVTLKSQDLHVRLESGQSAFGPQLKEGWVWNRSRIRLGVSESRDPALLLHHRRVTVWATSGTHLLQNPGLAHAGGEESVAANPSSREETYGGT
jgi:hypothetical protein